MNGETSRLNQKEMYRERMQKPGAGTIRTNLNNIYVNISCQYHVAIYRGLETLASRRTCIEETNPSNSIQKTNHYYQDKYVRKTTPQHQDGNCNATIAVLPHKRIPTRLYGGIQRIKRPILCGNAAMWRYRAC